MPRAGASLSPTQDGAFVERWEDRKARRAAEKVLEEATAEPIDLGAVVAKIGKLPDLPPRLPATELDTNTLRPVKALDLTDIVPADPPTGPPMIEWMAPTDLLVDATYQRDLSDKSLKLIQRIVEGWDWRKFKPPIVAWTERGFEIIDGQHTAIAAATHPKIDSVPVLVVEAPELQARASAFLGHNRDRLAVSPVQMHIAAVAAGDPDAVTVAQVCARAGVRIVPNAWGSYKYKPGDTLAVGALAQLVSRRGAMRARELLQVLVEAGCAPISAHGIKAVELLLTDPQYAEEIDGTDLVAAIKATADGLEKEAKVWSSEHCLPLWRGIAAVWFRKCKKRRKGS